MSLQQTTTGGADAPLLLCPVDRLHILLGAEASVQHRPSGGRSHDLPSMQGREYQTFRSKMSDSSIGAVGASGGNLVSTPLPG